MAGRQTRTIDATELAVLIRASLPNALLGFDVDGVLAPIVDHANESSLSPGVASALDTLASRYPVAIISGRSLESLDRLFEFPDAAHVLGSHGLEVRAETSLVLRDDEQYVFDQLELIGQKAVEATGEGAWLEYKPASVVVHSRLADQGHAAKATEALVNLVSMIHGAQIKTGHHVIELLARRASKGEALVALGQQLGRSTLVFIGDDVTDEDAFIRMGDDDFSVRVGPGTTAARYRINGPDDVIVLLTHLASFPN